MAKKATKKSAAKKKKKKKAKFLTNHVIGVLHTGSQSKFSGLVGDMKQAALQYLANEGHPNDTIQIHLNGTVSGHYSDDNAATLATHATTLVASGVKVILAAGGPQSALAAMDATDDAASNMPVVFTTVADPEGLGLVDALDEPGGNLTGVAGKTSENDPKRLKLLYAYVRQMRPNAKKVGVLINPGRQGYHKQFLEMKKAARRLGLTLVPARARTNTQIAAAFASFNNATEFVGAVVTADALFNNKRDKIITEANGQGVPTIYQWREFVDPLLNPTITGLISFGPNLQRAYQEAGRYVARVCLGELPQDMECAPPGPYELVVNQSNARQIFNDPLHVPPSRLLGKKVIVIP